MSLVLKDRVLETAAAPGTGAVTLLGAVTGYQTFSAAIGNGNTCYYTIADQSGANWEVGIGTYSSSGNTLARTTVLSSSNAGSTVNFASGTQNVFVTYPSEKAVYLDASGNVQPSLGTATFSSITDSALTSGRVTYAGTGGLLQDSSNLTFNGTTLTANTLNLTNALGVSYGGTGLTTLTSGYIPYGNGTSAFSSSSNLFFDGTNLGIGNTTPSSFNSLAKQLVVGNGSTDQGITVYSGTTNYASLFFAKGTTTTQAYQGYMQYQMSSDSLQFGTSATERMRLTSAGYLGIGTNSPSYPLQVVGPIYSSGNGSSSGYLLTDSGGTARNILFLDSSSYLNINNAYTPGIKFYSNYNTLGMTLDSSGNLGLGVTPSAWSGYRGFQIGGTTSLWSSTSGNASSFYTNNGYFNGANRIYLTTGYASEYIMGAGSHYWYTAPSGTAGNAITFTQAMTLDNSGNLLVGTTNTSPTTGIGNKITVDATAPYFATVGSSSSSGNAAYTLYSTGAGAYRFYVDYGGTVHATSTSITAISDQSLKTNIKPLETGLAEVMKLQPRRFDWINGDATNVAGFVAQEVQEVLPDLVGDYKYSDTETKLGLKMGDMIPTLVKAIQEQQAIIEQLKQKVGI